MRHLLAYLLAFVPCLGQAQGTPTSIAAEHHFLGRSYYQNAQDSADFARFWKQQRFVHGSMLTDTVDTSYRLQWIVSEHGGISSITRGDSSILQYEPDSSWGLFPNLHFRLADGRRGVQVVHEIPCGLICRSTLYYIED